jgi:hypothetical protein
MALRKEGFGRFKVLVCHLGYLIKLKVFCETKQDDFPDSFQAVLEVHVEGRCLSSMQFWTCCR